MNAILERGRFRANLDACEPMLELLDQLETRRIIDSDDREDIYRLRYRAYRSRELIEPSRDQRCKDEFDQADNTAIFGLYDAGIPISSLRISLIRSERDASPATMVFGDVLRPMINLGVTFIDTTRLTIAPDVRTAYKGLNLATMRLSVLACLHHDVDFSLSLIRPSHTAFYRRYFGFHELAPPRAYPGLKFPVALYASSVKAERTRIFHAMPIFNSLRYERQLLFDEARGRTACYSVRSTARLAARAILKSEDLIDLPGYLPVATKVAS